MEELTSVVCQEWLTTLGGSELVAAELARLVNADRVVTFAKRDELAERLFDCHVETTRLGDTDFARRRWQWMLPLMPAAWRSVDLSDANLVVTSSHSCVNAIRQPPSAVRVSYCHTPMRYAWFWRDELRRFPRLIRPVWPAAAGAFRRLDRGWSTRVDRYIANSRFTADRIRQCYGVHADVVHPPIDTAYWSLDESEQRDDFLLVAGRLVAYKRPEVVVRAARETGRRVVVAGDGPMLSELRELASGNVEFVVGPSRAELRTLYRSAAAVVYPQVEEFGMTLAEAQSCGTPAIAIGRGGACDSVVPGVTGVLVEDDASLADAMQAFDPAAFTPASVSAAAQRFSVRSFRDGVAASIRAAFEARSLEPPSYC